MRKSDSSDGGNGKQILMDIRFGENYPPSGTASTVDTIKYCFMFTGR